MIFMWKRIKNREKSIFTVNYQVRQKYTVLKIITREMSLERYIKQKHDNDQFCKNGFSS